ncbi:NUDIX hydrolase [Sinanaerobacter sp. ZZT-01]|uniref:NUDIX hydrolase n=1 Tax=Sinanaerobacter sp. ZZT-01 TaxID=3111540 RepID=UPI002D79F379|nr:NUDIX hydrolase [Sinanaerobacter sp. ZZT-01]WRR92510.1 NUDIX hydrolase [Sinanaerobacter sp. ZZT-01]
MTYEEKTISSEMIYKGAILNLRKDKVTVKGEATSYREIVEHNGGVGIAALTSEGKMLMIKQFRKPAEKVVLEIPAGKKEMGEEPMITAIRELKEETGYSADQVTFLSAFYSSIGYSTEIIYLYLATGLNAGETNFDEHEAIDLFEYDVAELKKMVIEGEIIDGKTINAILLVAARLGI